MSALILLVEDNDLNRDMLRRRLSRVGYEVIIAEDGEQALAMIGQNSPDLVLLDMNLPILDGWDTCRQVRSQSGIADTRILALTAHAMEEHRKRAMEAGCDDYATKPVDFPDLLDKIGGLLAADDRYSVRAESGVHNLPC